MAKAINMKGADPEWVASSISHIARSLRDQDRAELDATHGMVPELIIPQSVLLSTHGWIAVDRGEPVAVFGAAPSPISNVGIVWMLGTDGINHCGRSVARQTVPLLDEMHAQYPVLWNYIDTRNTVSVRWLRWCGFELLGERITASGHPLHIFARSRHV